MTDGEFDAFFRDVYPRLVAFGLAMSAPLPVAQELAQETMIRADAHRDKLQSFELPYGWCRRVMANLLIDQHRKRTAEQSAIDRLEHHAIADRSGQSSQIETDDAWASMLAPLTWQQRCIATLYYGEDRSVAAIADDLGLSTGSVKTTLARVRTKVERHLRATTDNEEMRS